MPPKKAKAKGKKAGGKGKRVSKAVVVLGRDFYDARIAEINHLLSDLRTQHVEIGDRHEVLLKEQEDLVQDEKDIISYLNRMIQVSTDEINSIHEECDTVEAERVQDAQNFEDEKEKMKEDYQHVEENLLSNMKLTVGKMHALEEFRLLRDELMQKYELFENDAEEQKVRHKREIYEVEKKFIIGEDKLKKEMDAKLKWLIEKFQSVTDVRVAATTLRVLKENIALNNMIEIKLQKLRKLYDIHDKLESHDGRMQLLSQMSVFEANAMAKQSRSLRGEIIGLVNEYYDMQTVLKKARDLEPIILRYRKEIKNFTDRIGEYATKQLILEQNLHELRCQREEVGTKIRHEHERNEELKDMLRQVESMLQSSGVNDEVFSIYDQSPEDEPAAHSKSTVLYKIHEFLMQVRDWNRHPKLMMTLEDRNDIYMQGRVGLVPRQVILKCMLPTMDEKTEQVDGSFDLLPSEKSWEYYDEEEIEIEESEVLGEEESVAVVVEQETHTDVNDSNDTSSSLTQ